MLTRWECLILSMKTFAHFECNIEIYLEFYVRVGTCEKRATGKQPLTRYANFKVLALFISLEIDCFQSQKTRKYLHSRTKSSDWLRQLLVMI